MQITVTIRETNSGRISVTTEARDKGVRVSRKYNVFRNVDAIPAGASLAERAHSQATRIVREHLAQLQLF